MGFYGIFTLLMQIGQILRAEKWWQHILPPIFLFYYAALLPGQSAVAHPFLKAVCLALVSILTAFGGYFLNDLFDIESDLKAGKQNQVSRFAPRIKRFFMPALIGLLACVLLIFYRLEVLSYENLLTFTIVLSLNFLLFLLYSLPGTRFKEIPFLAPVADALYSGSLFYLLAVLSSRDEHLTSGIAPGAGGSAPVYLTLTVVLCWGLLKGLRNYLNHLAEDCTHDAMSGIDTLATQHGAGRVLRTGNLFFPPECLLMLYLLPALSASRALLPAACCLIFLGLWIRDILYKKQLPHHYYNDLHEVWLPVSMLITVLLNAPQLYPLAILHLVLFPYHIPKLYFSFKKLIFVLFKIEWSFRKT